MTTPQTDLSQLRLVVSGSGGYVARGTGVVVVVPSVPSSAVPQTERLLNLCLDERLSSRALLRRVAYELGEADMAEVPGFCLLVAYDGSTPTLLAWGEVEIHLPGDPGPVSPAQQITWLERRVPDLDGLRITAVGASLADLDTDGLALLDLRSGVVAGSAGRLRSEVRAAEASARSAQPARSEAVSQDHQAAAGPPSQSVTQPIAPPSAWTGAGQHAPLAGTVAHESPVEMPQPTFESVQLTDDQSELTDVPPPLPMAGDALQQESALVDGIVCSRGHFNDPQAGYCTSCGISMRSGSGEFVSAPRPALGVLIFDDGTAFTVDGAYVLGREPEIDPAVVKGEARPLTFTDEANTISRVHALLQLDGWRVLLQDCRSANGTFVMHSPDLDGWRRLEPGQPTVLTPGVRVRFGRRVAFFESPTHQG